MALKEEIIDFYEKLYHNIVFHTNGNKKSKTVAKICAIIAIKNKYNALREQLFGLNSCGAIEREKVYLTRIHELIAEEDMLLKEIESI